MTTATAADAMQETADRAEAAVLGACLIGADVDLVAAHIADDEHMWGREGHRTLWDAIAAVHGAGVAVDLTSVVDHLTRNSRLAEVGGPSALVDLAAAAPARSSAEHWATQAADAAQRRRAWRAARQLMADVADPTIDPWGALQRVQQTADGHAPGGGLEVVSGPAILDLPPTAWLVEGWWPHGIGLLWGRRSSYKSFVTLSLALAIANDRPWWGNPVATPGPVVYVAAEGRGGIAPRLEAAIDDPSDLDRLHVVSGAGLQLTSSQDVARLDAVLARHRPVLTIIDTWARLSGVRDENDNAEASTVTATMDRLTDRHGTAWLIVHHSSADDTKARGATAIEDNVEVSYSARRDGHVSTLANEKPPKDAAVPSPLKFGLRPRGRSAVLEQIVDGRGRTHDDQQSAQLFEQLQGGAHIGVAAAIANYGQDAVDRARAHPEVVEYHDDAAVPRFKHRHPRVTPADTEAPF